ncbi:aminotransferase class IV [Hymenobacter sp. CRA2]|uniref:aminotransferase class IV n=1 Tax=Hymenobacter sp. CRA2 TaxID=1955620 RepID=UPI00098EC1FA|nr:aminotransferase class IV [Hymenobacter sp. CRA2]OON69481.1 hypothetical protein B0919_09405 [Hymenobacter sp. CRA2]
MSDGYALLDGTLLPAREVQLALPNRGLQFNDGFFETMIYEAGRLRWAAEHLARMQQAARVLHLSLPPSLSSVAQLTGTLQALADAQPPTTGAVRLRLQLWRAGGGLYTPATSETHWLATATPHVPNDAPVGRAGIAHSIRTHFSPVSFCKGPYALHYVLAAQERAARGLDELLLLDAHGHVAEAVAAAVFWIRQNELFTPALETGCVAGVRRARLLQVAEAAGIRCHMDLFPLTALLAAEAVFTANVAGIRLVQAIDGQEFAAQHPLVDLLRYREAATQP